MVVRFGREGTETQSGEEPGNTMAHSAILVTGGAGFIGGCFVRRQLATAGAGPSVLVNLDKLSYAGNLDSLESVAHDPRHVFIQGDIGDRALVGELLAPIGSRPS